jgi:hypothetical protein
VRSGARRQVPLGKNVCEVVLDSFEVLTATGKKADTANGKITRLTNAWEKNQLTFGGRTFLEPLAAPPAASSRRSRAWPRAVSLRSASDVSL